MIHLVQIWCFDWIGTRKIFDQIVGIDLTLSIRGQ